MQQSELERQTEELAGMLEQDVKDIKRTDVVHCFQMAKKRLSNLMELVGTDAALQAQAQGEGGAEVAEGSTSGSRGYSTT